MLLVKKTLEKSPTFLIFSSKCNASCAESLSRNKKLAFLGNYPSLTVLNATYGETSAKDWLSLQIEDLNKFYGSSVPMDASQIQQTASVITLEPRFMMLKVTEYILFFTMFKLGKFGEVYGSLKPSDITKALYKFLSTRSNELKNIEAEEEKIKREKDLENSITYDEWQKIKESNK